MKKEIRIEGTPFTRRRKVISRAETPADMAEGLHRLSGWSQDPWAAMRQNFEWVERALEQERTEHGSDYCFRPREDAGWYLEELRDFMRIADLNITKGDARWAAYAGAKFGELWSELQLKLAREELFLLGAKTLEERSRGGGWNRKATPEQKIASYRKFRAVGHNKTDATYLAAQELGVAESNIRAARKAAGASD